MTTMSADRARALLGGANGRDVLAGHANRDGLTLVTSARRSWSLPSRRRRERQEVKRDGTRLIVFSTGLLYMLDAGLLAVSIAAQYRYFLTERGQITASMIEAAALDAGMIIFSLLALGSARKGLPARVERALIVVCALASAAMNYANARPGNWRSIAAWTMPAVFLAIVTDRVVATTRRHFLGMGDGRSAWRDAASATGGAARALAFLALYSLRFLLAPPSTAMGVRRAVLNAAPLPQAPECQSIVGALAPVVEPSAIGGSTPAAGPVRRGQRRPGPSKKAVLLDLYRQHEGYGDRGRVSPVAAELAPQARLQAGTARTYLYEYLARGEA